jgi:hypothetical protein
MAHTVLVLAVEVVAEAAIAKSDSGQLNVRS